MLLKAFLFIRLAQMPYCCFVEFCHNLSILLALVFIQRVTIVFGDDGSPSYIFERFTFFSYWKASKQLLHVIIILTSDAFFIAQLYIFIHIFIRMYVCIPNLHFALFHILNVDEHILKNTM